MGRLSQAGGSSDYGLDYGVIQSAATAIEVYPRAYSTGSNSVSLATGRIHFTFFRAKRTLTIGNFVSHTGGTAAAATPTVARQALYTVPESWTGNMTCVAACANDTALWASTFTTYTRALSTEVVGATAMPASYQMVQGTLYASAFVIVTAAAVPSFYALQSIPGSLTLAPRVSAALNGQTNLALEVAISSLATSTTTAWAAFTT